MHIYFISADGKRCLELNQKTGEITRFETFTAPEIAGGGAESKPVPPEKEKTLRELIKNKRAGEKAGKRIIRCKKCQGTGHQARTCPDAPDRVFNVKGTSDDGDDEFQVTSDVIEEINDLLSEGKGSKEIAEHFGIKQKVANQAIAKAKGIDLA